MKLILTLFMCAVFSGCVTSDQMVLAKNVGSRTITGASIESSGGFGFQYGILIPGAYKACIGRKHIRRSEISEVSWIDADGHSHSVKLDLSQQLPAGFSGDIMFYLHENGKVSVRPDTKPGPR